MIIAFSEKLVNIMNLTAIKLCKEVQCCQLAFVQSDEISLLLHNYKRYNSEPWFDNEIPIFSKDRFFIEKNIECIEK